MADQDRSAMLQKLRERLQKKKGGFRRDPAEWRAPQVTPGEEFKAKVYILPPLEKGDACASGTAEIGMDGLFFTQVGDHWINKKKFPCPRVYDNDDCPYCQLGFDLLSETEQKAARSEISRAYLPRTQYVCNLFFADVKTNPDELRGKVVFYAMPKTIFDKLEECISLDSAGHDPDDPQAWGIFYDPNDAYPLSIVINKKGDYNSYTDSKLLAAGRGKIASSQKKIDEILAQRHDVPGKYPERTAENRQTLQGFVDSLMNGASGSDSGSGFDADETAQKAAAPAEKASTPDPAPANEVPVSTASTDTAATEEVEDDELNALLNSLKKSD
jgi:hypothetical protein